MTLESSPVKFGFTDAENHVCKALDARASSRFCDVANATSPTTTPTTNSRPAPFARRARPPGPPENTAARTCVREYSTKHIVFLKQDVLFKMSLLTT